MAPATGMQPTPALWPADLQPPPRRRAVQQPMPDLDELSAGNAGFEDTTTTPQERAEYQRGWRVGMGSGLVGGALLGAVAMLSAVWLGVRAGLAVL
jgi:hypothetical protein